MPAASLALHAVVAPSITAVSDSALRTTVIPCMRILQRDINVVFVYNAFSFCDPPIAFSVSVMVGVLKIAPALARHNRSLQSDSALVVGLTNELSAVMKVE